MEVSFNWTANVTNKTGGDFFVQNERPCYDLVSSVEEVFYLVVLIIGVVGNSLVIIVIVKVKDMLNSTNIFLANLAISDIMFLIFWVRINIGKYIYKLMRYTFGINGHNIFLFITYTSINASVLTVLAIGFERYYAICQPLRAGFICTKKRAFRICILAWALAALSNSHRLINGSVSILHLYLYFYYTETTIFFIVPPVVLVVLFSTIVRRLNVSVAPNVNIAAIKHRRHVITMLATVIFCFFLLQMPLRVFFFIKRWWRSEIEGWLGFDRFHCTDLISSMLVYLHSTLNPILYNLMSTRFRAGFKETLCFYKLR